MSSNHLCLNPLKTQHIWLGICQQLAKFDLVSLSHEFPTFVFSTSVRDLGVILDQELSFAEHISSLSVPVSINSVNCELSPALSLPLPMLPYSSCFCSQPTIQLLSSLSWPSLCSLATFGWYTQSR